jgi:hypothetical protein
MKAIIWCIGFVMFAGQDGDKNQQMAKKAEKELKTLQTLLERIYQWEMMEASDEGKYFRQEIEKVLLNRE